MPTERCLQVPYDLACNYDISECPTKINGGEVNWLGVWSRAWFL